MNRLKLLFILAIMPDEAWGWFVLWASGQMTQYPDGLGGFQNESRKSIVALRKEAKLFMKGMN